MRQVDLPVCASVRVRRMVTEDPHGTEGDWVVEGIGYFGLPEGFPGLLVFDAQWAAAAIVDALATRLEMDFVQ